MITTVVCAADRHRPFRRSYQCQQPDPVHRCQPRTPPIHHVVPTPIAPSVGPILGRRLLVRRLAASALSPPPRQSPDLSARNHTYAAAPARYRCWFPDPVADHAKRLRHHLPGSFGPNPNTGSLAEPGAGGVANVPRAMPPGGMIGGVSGPGLGQPGAAASPSAPDQPGRRNDRAAALRRGAVWLPWAAARDDGELASQAARRPRVGDAGQRPVTAPGGRAGMHGEDERDRPAVRDPGQPHRETDEGVAPVDAGTSGSWPHRPGPAIGFNR